ncbi:alpha/beta hydrolase [Allokutzneria sp. A3M-2-11 16]|uniref:alpha/beta fold hydrolase n=1 Tax=Allokutzneria sp. A3M-2-11 16 TaxID=2962043 RepID=UPI0020B80378|nr:alpha/beta hydrolase [Allokutzneria sp. A3M-2-11 16]MCP3799588.1 alpha/beta hydrolase [Allokutzneria sp. A3M-2-11 16]
MPFAEINGQRVHYEDSGGEGLALVFSHGILMDHEMFAAQQELAREYRVITWDARGHGLTESDRLPFTYWDLARDCLGLLDHLEIEQAALVGVAEGGFAAMRTALLAPDRIVALALISTLAGEESPRAQDFYGRMFGRWLAEGPVDELTTVFAALTINSPAENARWAAKWRERDRELIAEPATCLLERDDISERLRQIRCPAVVMYGTADPLFGAQEAEELSEALRYCVGVVPIEGGAHASPLTCPDQVNAALSYFLGEI